MKIFNFNPKSKWLLSIALIVVSLLILTFTPLEILEEVSAATNLQVHFIDVGQGDAILINLPNGQNIMIDAGENNYGTTVVNYLKGKGISKLDYVVGTHPHSDHIGGLDVVIDNFNIGKVYLPAKTSTTVTYQDLLNSINRKGLKITTATKGVTLINTTVNGVTLQAYMVGPTKSTYTNVNDHSAVLRVVYGSTSFLFSGDAETTAETDIVNSGQVLSSNILKVGHHGSSTSTSDAFLNKVNPSAAVISVGPNTYGHPSSTVINKLKNRGIKIYRTDTSGSIIFTTSGSGWLVNKAAWWQP